jgi:hypothetical protein
MAGGPVEVGTNGPWRATRSGACWCASSGDRDGPGTQGGETTQHPAYRLNGEEAMPIDMPPDLTVGHR